VVWLSLIAIAVAVVTLDPAAPRSASMPRVRPDPVTETSAEPPSMTPPVIPPAKPPAITREVAAVEAIESTPTLTLTAPTVLRNRTRLRGRVFIGIGERIPCEGAEIHVGSYQTRSDADGGFEFPGRPDSDATLVVVHRGFAPAVVERAAALALAQAPSPLRVGLSSALSISGRVEAPNGGSLIGWQLELADGLAVESGSFPPLSAEDLAAGGGVPQDQVRDSPVGWRPRPESPNRLTLTEDGLFEVRGLRRFQKYRLRAWRQTTLDVCISPPIFAGTQGYVWRLRLPPKRPSIGGIVTDAHGVPKADVRVRPTMIEHQGNGGTSFQSCGTTHTDENGRFTTKPLPDVDLILRVDGPDIRGVVLELPPGVPCSDLHIVVGGTGRLRFESNLGAGEADALRVLDAEFESLVLVEELTPGRTTSNQLVRIEGGRSRELIAPISACWLVLYRNSAEVRRVRLHLDPENPTIVR